MKQRNKQRANLDDPVGCVSVRAAVVAEGRRRRPPAVEAEHVALVARGRRVRAAGQEEARTEERLQPLGHRRRRGHAPQHHALWLPAAAGCRLLGGQSGGK